jgi:hypothetical protein
VYANDNLKIRNQFDGFNVPETSKVSSRVDRKRENIFGYQTQQIEIELSAQKPNDPLMVNYRRPFLHAELKDVLSKSDLSLEQINAIFGKDSRTSSDQYQVIANFAHGFENYKSPFEREVSGKDNSIFWYAVFPKEVGVKSAGVQVEWFSDGLGNHMQLHLSLDSNILLIPQASPASKENRPRNFKLYTDRSNSTSEGAILNGFEFDDPENGPVLIKGDIIYALMGLKSKNGLPQFSFVNGITGNLTVGLVMTSLIHMETDQMSRGSFIEEYPINQMNVNLNNTLAYILSQNKVNSDGIIAGNLYNTVFQNCIKEVMKAIEASLDVDYAEYNLDLKIPKFDSDQFNPYTVAEYLIGMEIVSKQKIDLNVAYSSYRLVPQSRITVANNSVIGKVEKALPFIKSPQLDTFVRKFAYDAAKNKWTAEAVNEYLAIIQDVFKNPSSAANSKSVAEFIKEKLMNSKNLAQIEQIHKSVVASLLGALDKRDTAEIKLEDYQKYIDKIHYISSLRQ